MRIKREYYISYDEGDMNIMRRRDDGTEEYVSPISDTAAMVWDGFARGLDRETVIDAVVNEFQADRDLVAADLDALCARLVDLGYAEI